MINFWNEHYLFLVVAIGLSLLSIAASIIGSSLVLEKQSQLGDAIGHAAYPGVIIAFMISGQRDPLKLLIGAMIAGIFAILLTHWIARYKAFHFESILGLILSSFFGIGMVLMSYIQGNSNYPNASQAGLNNYIIGQAAYLKNDDLWIIGITAVVVIFIFWLCSPMIKLTLFDRTFAESIGIKTHWISLLNMLLAISVISVGLKAVGALLISSLLITPTIIALQWTNRYHKTLLIASLSSLFACILGTYLSTTIDNLATGPTVVLTLFAIALFSMIFGTNGYFRKKR